MPEPEDHALAARLAAAAGDLLVELRRRLVAEGAEQGHLKLAGDLASHQFLVGMLAELRPGDAVLSEESWHEEEQDPAVLAARLAAARVWIVDPLDGTREYSEGREDWAVHVALVEGGRPTAGAVALPDLGLVCSTADPPPVPPAPERPRVVLSRTRRPAEAEAVVAGLQADRVEMGSAGAKTMAILRGEADIYPHAGGQYEWDSAAPVAVAAAAGLHATRLDGSPLRYNNENPYLPDLLVCRPEHADAAVRAAASVAG